MRFRPNRGASWSWHGQGNNGQIIFRPLNIAASLKFETLFSEPDDTLSVKSINSQVVGVHLFDVTSVAPALNEAWSTVNLGKPVSLEKFYATVCYFMRNCQNCADQFLPKGKSDHNLVGAPAWDHHVCDR
jgi:hypothetical protein